MTREEAIWRFENVKANALVQKANGVSEYWQNEIDGTVEAIDMAIEALSERNIAREIATILENEQDMRVMLQNDAEPKMTEEVREALMRLTMCAREECGMCKYKDKCGFEFQYNISTENMNTILEALSADTVSREEYEELYRKAKEVNGMANDILADFPRYKELFAVVRCKDCRHGWYDDDIEYYTCRHPKGLNEELYGVDYCSYGERREP